MKRKNSVTMSPLVEQSVLSRQFFFFRFAITKIVKSLNFRPKML